MQAYEALLRIVNEKGPKAKTSVAMGRHPHYLTSTLQRKSVPRADIYAEILDACECDLLIRRRSDSSEIVIEPNGRDSADAKRRSET